MQVILKKTRCFYSLCSWGKIIIPNLILTEKVMPYTHYFSQNTQKCVTLVMLKVKPFYVVFKTHQKMSYSHWSDTYIWSHFLEHEQHPHLLLDVHLLRRLARGFLSVHPPCSWRTAEQPHTEQESIQLFISQILFSELVSWIHSCLGFIQEIWCMKA